MSFLNKLIKKEAKKKDDTKESSAPLKPVEKKKEATNASRVHKNAQVERVLLRPIVSEKSAIREQGGTYTFEVEKYANKVMIKQAIRAIYGVMPTNVRVMHVDGKAKNSGRTAGRREHMKKAMVTLPKGKTIEIHTGV